MPPKTYIVSSYETSKFGPEAQSKLPETFAKDVDEELARIGKLGGRIMFVSVIDLNVLLVPPEDSEKAVKGYGRQSTSDRKPGGHLVIIADIPDDSVA